MQKAILKTTALIILLASFILINGSALAGVGATMAISLTQVNPNTTVRVNNNVEVQVSCAATNGGVAAFSCFSDISYPSNLLQFVSISYDADYPNYQQGVDNGNGAIEQLGAVAGSVTPPAEAVVATITFKALATGNATITTAEETDSVFSENTIYGTDGDQSGANTIYGQVSFAIDIASLVSNGDFNNGETDWSFLGDVSHTVNNGVLEMYSTRTDTNGASALLAQFIGSGTQGDVIEATVDLGNSSSRTKYVTFRLNEFGGSNEAACLFAVPGNTSLSQYKLTAQLPSNWASMEINLFVDDFNEPALLVDNILATKLTGSNVTGTVCEPNLPSSKNLLVNGDFLNGTFGYFFLNDFQQTVSNGVLEITTTGAAPALLSNPVRYKPSSGENYEASVQLGNPSNADRQVDIRMFDFLNFVNNGDASNFIACSFIVPAQSPLRTYTFGGQTVANWTSLGFEMFIIGQTTDIVQVDNISVQKLDSAPNGGSTYCNEPSLIQNGDFSNGTTGYVFGGAVDQAVNSEVLNMTRTDANSFAAVTQDTNVGIGTSGTRTVTATIDLGNTTSRGKYVTFRLSDGAAQERACLFNVPGNSSGTYTLNANITGLWPNLQVDLFVDDFNEQYLTVDNLTASFVSTPAASDVVCTPNIPVDTNLVNNADFNNDTFAYFFLNDAVFSVTGGQLAVNSQVSEAVPALVSNPLRYKPTTGQTYEASLKITNNSAGARQVDMRMFDFLNFINNNNASNFIACSIQVPAGQTITYTFSGNMTADWTSIGFEMFIFDHDAANPLLFDDITVVRKSTAAPSNNNCPALGAGELTAAQQTFEVPDVIDSSAEDREEGRGGNLDVAIVDEPIIPDDEFPAPEVAPDEAPVVEEAESLDRSE